MKKYIEYNKRSGIYVIKNVIDNKIYIGSSVNIYQRIKDHLKALKSNTHKNDILQNYYNKYGLCFYFEVLDFCNAAILIELEQCYLDMYKPYERKKGFNINKVANSMLGFKNSEKTKQSWSDKRTGILKSDSTKKNMSLAKQGSSHPRSKLKEKDVLDIRSKYKFRKITCKMLAAKYNVSEHTILYIINRRTWKHI